MSEDIQVQLKTTAILQVPLQTYDKDFTFIVNGKEFNTSCINSDLLSPKVSEIHQIDPTIRTFTINTTHEGDFENILKLLKFSEINIPTNQIEFFYEVNEILGNDQISHKNKIKTNLTNDNVLDLLLQHEKFNKFFHTNIDDEIEYISTHFFELCENNNEKLKRISIENLERIISHPKLQLNDEDQLFKFINDIYENYRTISILYGQVLFCNASVEMISKFVSIFNKDDLTADIWESITHRLMSEIETQTKTKSAKETSTRYKEKPKPRGKIFYPKDENTFDGIIRHLEREYNNNLDGKINITASSNENGSINVTHYDRNDLYQSNNESNSWICFDFIDHKIIPSKYQIKTYSYGPSSYNPKTWIVEGSNDNSKWTKIGYENNCSYTNGRYL